MTCVEVKRQISTKEGNNQTPRQEDTTLNNIMDWEKEIDTQISRLDSVDSSQNSTKKFVALEEAHDVFVTGATGFLGAFLLKELCTKQISTIWCLVRGNSKEAGKQRILENMKKYGQWEDKFDKNIKVVVGDLTQQKLGMNDEDYLSLSSIVQIVFHLGAIVNYALPYQEIVSTTVGGTVEVIKFCVSKNFKSLHFVSTNAVFPLVPPPEMSTHCEEKVLPKKIYRPGWIGFSFSNGASNPLDLLAWMVGICMVVEAGPISGGGCEKWRLESFPVDVLAKIISGTNNTIVHETPQITAAAVYTELSKNGHLKKLVEQQEWRLQITQKEKEWTEQAEKGNLTIPKEAIEELKSFLPMLDEYAHWLVDSKTYGQENLKKALKTIGLEYPEMNEKTFLKQIDFLQKGTVIKMCAFK